jgi:hypothetical protein
MGPSYFFTGCKVSESWKPVGLALLELATVGQYNKHLEGGGMQYDTLSSY